MNDIKKQATHSVLWSAVERFSVQGIQYVISILLARQLLPHDYGLIAMLSIFMAIAQTFIDGGFGNALIQKKERTATDYSTVFYFNIVLSIVLYAMLFIASPFIADFYNEPQLDTIAKVFGITLIINSLGIVQQAYMTVILDFKRQAIASLIAVTISGAMGVVMAYQGFGVWALVWHAIVNNILRVMILWLLSKWKPEAIFSKKSFKEMFSFGSKLLASAMLHTIYSNVYTLVIGLKFASTELGYFNRASTLAQFPSTNFTNIIVRAVYPIQCQIQDDTEQLNRMFLVYLRLACYIIFPIMLTICVLAEPLIGFLMTEKWLPAVPFFQILCIAYMWDPVMKINHNMLNVKGHSDFFLQAEIIKKIVAVIILIVTIPMGITVMCWGLLAYSLADMIIIITFTRRITGISHWQQCRSLLPVVFLSVSMGGVIYLVMQLFSSYIPQLIFGLSVGTIYYLVMSYIFKFKEIKELVSIIKRRK